MTALEFMERQVEKCHRNLAMVSNKNGVTDKELENIRLKIKYYEEAVEALKQIK